MVKKLGFQNGHADRRRRTGEANGRRVVEAIDLALVAVMAAVMIWLQWLPQRLPG